MNLIKNILKESNDILKKNYLLSISAFIFFSILHIILGLFLIKPIFTSSIPIIIFALLASFISYFLSILYLYITKVDSFNFFDFNKYVFINSKTFLKAIYFTPFLILILTILFFVLWSSFRILIFITVNLPSGLLAEVLVGISFFLFFFLGFLYFFLISPIIISLFYFPSVFLYLYIDNRTKSLARNFIDFIKLVKNNFKKFFLMEATFLIFKILITLSFGLLSLWFMPLTYIARARFYIHLSEGANFKYEVLENNEVNSIEYF